MEQNQNKRRSISREPRVNLSEGRLPPSAIELEESVLGHLIGNISYSQKILTWLKVEHFYKETHQLVYRAILDLWNKKEPIDLLTVQQQLKKNGMLDNVGGPYGLTLLSAKAVGGTPEHHARIIQEKYLAREVIRIGSKYVNKGYDDTCDVLILLDDFDKDIKDLSSFKREALTLKGKHVADEMMKEIMFLDNNPDAPMPTVVYKTGDKKFDEIVGLSRDKTLLIVGSSGDGKSRYVRSLMFKLLKNYGNEIAIDWVTLEDPAVEVIRGYISNNLKIKTKVIKERTYDKKLNQIMIGLAAEFKQFDIEFTEVKTRIQNITDHFCLFCEERPDKFCILIIDNILSMDEHHATNFKGNSVAADDFIMDEILRCKQLTHGLIIPIHHFNTSALDKGNMLTGFRPSLNYIKGSESYRRTVTQALLINNPSQGDKKDLLNEYPKELRDLIKHIFIVDPGKNREDQNDESTIIRYLFSLNYDIFEPLD